MDFDKLYKKNVGLLLHITQSFGCSKEAGEEIVQDVFLKYFDQQPDIPPTKVKSYLAVMTRNQCLDAIRRKKSHKTDLVDSFSDTDNLDPMWHNDPSRTNLLNSIYLATKEATEAPGCDEFKRYYLDGVSLVDIAEEQGEPRGTIQARVHRCRKKFEQRIRELVVQLSDRYP